MEDLILDSNTSEVHVISYTGLLFQIQGAKPSVKLWNKTKREAIKHIKSNLQNVHYDIFFSVVMPCGEFMNLIKPKDIMDLPIKDIPCPCGDSTHWLVRFVSFD